MKLANFALCASIVSGCASAPPESSSPSPVVDDVPAASEGVPTTSGDGTANEASVAAPASAPTSAAHASGLSADELAFWSDPRFKRYFLESYIAETEIEPPVSIDERDLMYEIRDLLAEGKTERALRMLQKESSDEGNAVFDFTLANVWFQQDDLVQAAEYLELAVEKYPKFRRAWQNLGMMYFRLGEYDKSLPALTRVIELGGGSAPTYGMLGFAYTNVGNSLPAETAYRMAILLDPATMDWKKGLARSLFQQRRFADAVALTKSLIEEQPDSAELWLLQANAFIGAGEPLRAAENYEMVDQLGRSTSDSLANLGDIYVNAGLFDLALSSHSRSLALEADASPARALRAAKVMTTQGAMTQTKALVEKIEELEEDQLDAQQAKDVLVLRARIALAEGASDEEARVLEELVQLDPLDGGALISLGQHSRRNGDVEKAVFYFERAAGIEKFEADAKVRHAQLLVAEGRYLEAVPLLRRAQVLKPRQNIEEYLEQVEQVAASRGGKP